MKAEYKDHYLNGGKFTAIYNPKEMDIYDDSMVGKEIVVYQNLDIVPIIEGDRWTGQFRFNSSDIHGWIPEEDLDNLKPIKEYVENKEPLPQYVYKMFISDKYACNRLFGKDGPGIPYTSIRSYSTERDEYVLNDLTEGIPSIEIYKYIWNGENFHEMSKWEKLR